MGVKGDNKLKVVVLDNDPTYLSMWEKVFGEMPECSYCMTNDAKAAANIIKTENVDLVISEIVLQNSDGYSIAELAHSIHPNAEVLLTTAYDCDLTRFNLKDPRFSILYKPYNDMEDIKKFINHLLHHEDVFSDASEDSFSENETFPSVFEWKL